MMNRHSVIKHLSDTDLALSQICESRSYHLSNRIQSHFVLLVLNPEDFKIISASDNSAILFKQNPQELINTSLIDLLDNRSGHLLRNMFFQDGAFETLAGERIATQLTIRINGLETEAIFYCSQNMLCMELETPCFNTIRLDMLELYFVQVMESISSYNNHSSGLANLICAGIQKLSGYDRAWYCEFDADGHAFVSGEANNGVLASLLGHHFPSTDIPQAARRIYVKNKFRAIMDTECGTANMLSEGGVDTPPLDLTLSFARMPADTHLTYLGNMGVRASLSFSVVRDGQLIGLFGAHHHAPKIIKFRQMVVCQYLADEYLSRHTLIANNEERLHLELKEIFIDQIIDTIHKKNFNMENVFIYNQHIFKEIVECSSFLCKHNREVFGNEYLSPEEVDLVFKYINENNHEDIVQTDFLISNGPQFSDIATKASGILAVHLEESDTTFVWLREEHVQSEKWAGNPTNTLQIDEQGQVGPRKSFEIWINALSGRSKPWNAQDIAVVKKFTHLFSLKRAHYFGKIGYENAKRLDAVLNTVVDGIMSIDYAGIIKAFNPSAERIFGYKAYEVIGQHMRLLMDADINTFLGQQIVTSTRRDGSHFPMELGVNAVNIENEQFFVALARDISERIQFEENLKIAKETAERANAYKTQFLANMSHELRTPLHSMIGFSEIMAEKIDTMAREKKLQYLGLIRESGERLLNLINDLLDVSKLEAGKMTFNFADHDTAEIIERSIHAVQHLIDQKHLTITQNIPPGLILRCDQERLSQVMINLLSNAAKFSPPDQEILLTIAVQEETVLISFKDGGIGIPPAELEAIFDKFIQSSKTRNGAGGTGLGLSICREIVSAHQGRIWAKNNNDAGCSFFVELPLHPKFEVRHKIQ